MKKKELSPILNFTYSRKIDSIRLQSKFGIVLSCSKITFQTVKFFYNQKNLSETNKIIALNHSISYEIEWSDDRYVDLVVVQKRRGFTHLASYENFIELKQNSKTLFLEELPKMYN